MSAIRGIGIFFLLVVIVFIGCGDGKNGNNNVGEKITLVKTAIVEKGGIEDTISLSGDVYGQREVMVYSKVSGKLARKVKDEGEGVSKDETFALINRDEVALKFSEAEVRSPIKGIIIKYLIDLGGSVFPPEPMPQEPLALVADIDKVKVVVFLGERDRGRVRVGQVARVYSDAFPGMVFVGGVSEIAPAADRLTRKIKAEVLVNNKDHFLLPGTYVDVEIVVEKQEDTLLIPSIGVVRRDSKRIALVVEEERAKEREVDIGIANPTLTEIVRGLNEGEEVIIEGNYGLIEGSRVRVVK